MGPVVNEPFVAEIVDADFAGHVIVGDVGGTDVSLRSCTLFKNFVETVLKICIRARWEQRWWW